MPDDEKALLPAITMPKMIPTDRQAERLIGLLERCALRCSLIKGASGRDTWQAELPEFDGATMDAKYAVLHGLPHSPEQLHAWQAVARITDHFKSADKYLVSVPMWNFSIPYKLIQKKKVTLIRWRNDGPVDRCGSHAAEAATLM